MASAMIEAAKAVETALTGVVSGAVVKRTHRPTFALDEELYMQAPIISVTPLNMEIELASRRCYDWRPSVVVAYLAALADRPTDEDIEPHDDAADAILSTLVPREVSEVDGSISLPITGGRIVLLGADVFGLDRQKLTRNSSDTLSGVYHWATELSYQIIDD